MWTAIVREGFPAVIGYDRSRGNSRFSGVLKLLMKELKKAEICALMGLVADGAE